MSELRDLQNIIDGQQRQIDELRAMLVNIPVRLSNSREDGIFDVKLVKTGGVPGDNENQCSYVYTVSRIFGYDESAIPNKIKQLAVSVDPTIAPHGLQRPPVGGMLQATGGTARWIKVNGVDTLKLLTTTEQVDQEEC